MQTGEFAAVALNNFDKNRNPLALSDTNLKLYNTEVSSRTGFLGRVNYDSTVIQYDNTGRVDLSFVELEVPTQAAGGVSVSYVEFEVADAPAARVDVSFVELEVPNSTGRMDVSYVELEVPGLADGGVNVSWVRFEVPGQGKTFRRVLESSYMAKRNN